MKGLSSARAATAATLALVVFGSLGASAYASGAETFFSGRLAGGSSVQGDYAPLLISEAQNLSTFDRKCAGAVDTGGAFYGSYICTTTVEFAEHDYSGTKTLAPMLHNGISDAQSLAGHEWW